jgi:hypothetical protein
MELGGLRKFIARVSIILYLQVLDYTVCRAIHNPVYEMDMEILKQIASLRSEMLEMLPFY